MYQERRSECSSGPTEVSSSAGRAGGGGRLGGQENGDWSGGAGGANGENGEATEGNGGAEVEKGAGNDGKWFGRGIWPKLGIGSVSCLILASSLTSLTFFFFSFSLDVTFFSFFSFFFFFTSSSKLRLPRPRSEVSPKLASKSGQFLMIRF